MNVTLELVRQIQQIWANTHDYHQIFHQTRADNEVVRAIVLFSSGLTPEQIVERIHGLHEHMTNAQIEAAMKAGQ